MDRPTHSGPCNQCGDIGPKGLYESPSGLLVCAKCLDDCTGESARHGWPAPTR